MKTRFHVLCTLALALQFPARGAEVNLAGEVFAKGGKISVSSSDAVPPALLYDISFEAGGTGTGTFGAVLGSGDLATRLDQLQPGSSQKLRVTLANLSQKLPMTLGQTMAFDQLSNVPLGDGATGRFTSRGKVKLRIEKNGKVKASAQKMKFSASDQNGGNIAVTGQYAIDSGRLVVVPSPASSLTQQPDFILLLNQHFTIGNDEYETNSPGTVDVVRVKRGRTKNDNFVIQNDGPNTDSFKLFVLFPSNGVSLRVFDGKKEITEQAMSQDGFAINDLPSGGTKLFRMAVKVAKDAPSGSIQSAGVRVVRSADFSARDTGGFSVNVP
ncbi:MAG: hypothetical protein ABI680_14340 [Chthoniobacteraceae bacterium]